MKRLFILLFFAMTFTVSSFAQEVRGVETRVVKYVGSDYLSSLSDWNLEDPIESLWFGYEITNMNSIPVSVDLKLYIGSSENLRATKTVILQAKEKYIWKMESSPYARHFTVYPYESNYYIKRDYPGDSHWNQSTIFLMQYNAFKLL